MKKIFYFAFFAFLLCARIQAQSISDSPKLMLGLIGGLNAEGAYQPCFALTKASGGFVGLDVRYAISKKIPGQSLHFQPNWESFSANIPHTYQTNGFIFKSLNLPVLLRHTFLNQSRVRPFVELGISYKVRLKSINKKDEIICPFATPCRSLGESEQELIPGSDRSNVVLLAGLGAEVQFGKVQVPISIRVNEGAGTFSLNRGYNDREPFTNLKTRSVQVVAGVSF